MTVAPVGIRCPEHAGTRPRAVTAAAKPATVATKRVRRTAARHGYVIPEFSVTRVLVVVNVLIYLVELALWIGHLRGTRAGSFNTAHSSSTGPTPAINFWRPLPGALITQVRRLLGSSTESGIG